MDNKRPLLSIIVPVYNSEEYLGKAIETVLKQDFDHFELILVNDGSTDNSAAVCELYAHKDSRVKFFNKMNGGLCSARNFGLDHANGEYIMFMDNDDEYCPGAFRVVARIINNYSVDIIRFNRKRIQVFDNGSCKEDVYGTIGVANKEPVVFTRQEFFNNYVKIRKSGCFAGIWNAAFKRELFDNIRFDESITAGGEDAIVNMQLYGIFESIVFIPDILYIYYRRTKHSISTQFQTNHIVALGKEAAIERRLIHENGLGDDAFFAYAYVYLATLVKVLNHKNSNLLKTEKYRILKQMKNNSYGFDYEINDIKKSKIALSKKVYMGLYATGKYKQLFAVTNMIMKIRGNV